MPVKITSANFESEVLQADVPVLVDFWAPWCGPCRMIGPVLEDLAPAYAGRVKVAKVNVDEEPALAQAFQVRGIPTLYALHNGEVIDQMVGFGGKKQLEDAFAKLAEIGSAQSVAS
jgi:thioredoxin 1